MDELERVTVQCQVASGAEFPRTNFIGSIDPYIRVYLDGNILGETRHIKNQQEPVWNEDFFFDADRNEDGCLCGVLRFELYDENRARQDEHVGSVEIDLSELPPEMFDPLAQQRAEFYEYAIAFKDDKRGEKLGRQGRSPRLMVGFLGAIPSWSALVAQLAGWEEEVGLLAEEDSRQLYVPIPGAEGAGLYGGIQYLLPRAVHFKLVTVSKHHSGLHLDFKCSKASSLRVERVSYHRHRKRLIKGLRVYAEATLTNLPLHTDLRKLQLLVFKRRATATHIVAETLERAGFPADGIGPSLSYKRVSRSMASALLDAPNSCVFVPVGHKAPKGVLLQVDFGEGSGQGNAEGSGSWLAASLLGSSRAPVLRALTLKDDQTGGQGRELVYEFLTAGCEATSTITVSHRHGIKILGGEYAYVCASELPDVFDGQRLEAYDTAALVAYSLEAEPLATCRFGELFEPPPVADPAEDGNTLLDALDPELMPHSMGSMAVMVAHHGGKMMGKVVDQLGNLVGGIGFGAGIGSNSPTPGGGEGGGASVLKAIKAPLKLLRAGKDAILGKEAAPESDDGNPSGSGRGEHSGEGPGGGGGDRRHAGAGGGSKDRRNRLPGYNSAHSTGGDYSRTEAGGSRSRRDPQGRDSGSGGVDGSGRLRSRKGGRREDQDDDSD